MSNWVKSKFCFEANLFGPFVLKCVPCNAVCTK